jgi:hypothetical protein
MAILSFTAASFLALVLASAVSVYLGGQVEQAAGRAGAFQLLCVLSLVASVLLLAGFGIAAALVRRLPGPGRAAILGFACAAVFVALLAAASALRADPAESWLLLLALPLLGGLSPLVGARHAAQGPGGPGPGA